MLSLFSNFLNNFRYFKIFFRHVNRRAKRTSPWSKSSQRRSLLRPRRSGSARRQHFYARLKTLTHVLCALAEPNSEVERKSIFHCEKHVTAIIFYHHILPTRIFTFPLTLCNIFTIKTAIFAPHRNPFCILIVFLCLNLQRVNRLVLISRSREAFSIYSIKSNIC